MTHVIDQKDEIRALLDRGECKHTWHLPKRPGGDIDWTHEETLAVIYREKQAAIREAAELLSLAVSIDLDME